MFAAQNAAHAVGALLVLPERVPPRDHVGRTERDAVVERDGLHLVVVDVELFVRVAGGEVEDKVVAKEVVVAVVVVGGGVVELCEFGVGDMELEGAWLDNEVEDEEYEGEEEDDCEESLPEEAEEAAAAVSAAVTAGTLLLRRRDGGAVVGTV